MKYFFTILFFILFLNNLNAQQDSAILKQEEEFYLRQQQLYQKDFIDKRNTKPGKDNLNVLDTAKNAVLNNASAGANAKPVIKNNTIKDSVNRKAENKLKNYDSVLATVGLPVFAKPKFILNEEKKPDEKNRLFYIIVGLIFLLGLVKEIFPRYLKSTLGLFLQTTKINANARYMAHQNGLAFILMQFVFVFCGAVYLTLVSSKYFHLAYSFGEMFLFSFIFLASIYLIKNIVINFLGWVFNFKTEAKIYLLYVFLVNRVLAVTFIPIILVLAFSKNNIAYFVLIVSFILFAVSLIYRYFLTIKTVQPNLRAKTIQIFLYLCTVEFLPLVLLCKLIVNYTGRMN